MSYIHIYEERVTVFADRFKNMRVEIMSGLLVTNSNPGKQQDVRIHRSLVVIGWIHS